MEFLITGILLGASAGMAPGPLLALVISESLASGLRAGALVAVAPIITDAPIVVLSLALNAGLARFAPGLGIVSFAGALFVFFLGISQLQGLGNAMELSSASAGTFQINTFHKGLLANALSPHPWLFWFTVGGPMVIKALEQNWLHGAGFMVGFYGLLVGSKILVAALVARSRSFLTNRIHTIAMRILGVFLCILGVLLFRESLHYFGS